MTPVTTQQLKQLIHDKLEPIEPADTILRILQENDGKRLDKRIIDKIQAACPDWQIRDQRRFGMTQIAWGKSHYPHEEYGSLLIDHHIKCVSVDAAAVYYNNPAYFSARDKRNRQRQEILIQREGFFQNITTTINRFLAAQEDLVKLFDQLEEPGEFPDLYDIKKLIPKMD
jgi:hypothetical protein